MKVLNSSGQFNVNLINPNGSDEETIKGIITAVDSLHSISCEIFNSIRNRVQEQRDNLQKINRRVDYAQEIVKKIQGAQKGIRITSAAKYPVELDETRLINLPLTPISAAAGSLEQDIPNKNEGLGVELVKKRKLPPSRFDPPIKHPDDLLACYHVREPHVPSLLMALQELGIGKPPKDLNLVDSFLLFNTTDSPYQNYQLPKKSQPVIQPVIVKGKKTLESNAGVKPEKFESFEAFDDFYYSPSTLQVPEINVPEFLPDLPGVVDNLGFSSSDSFTPPFFQFSNQKQQQKRLSWEKIENVESSNNSLVDQGESILQTPMSSIFSPIVTSNHPSSEESKNQSLLVEAAVSIPSVSVPPPPPPPPASIPAPSATPRQSDDTSRSNLMAAIRAAAGGKVTLRSAQERKYDAKKKKQEEKENTGSKNGNGGDLMADLKNSLAMRRKGISGIREGPRPSTVGGMSDIMSKLVNTIPAIERSTESNNFDDDDDEDEENDDWD